ncbi:hypothetical protein GXW82_44535 [Streptacidiphilus sp. 4-A2]|nr:hypothetical protein [Streptacidiphilus sp. 4-A2]
MVGLVRRPQTAGTPPSNSAPARKPLSFPSRRRRPALVRRKPRTEVTLPLTTWPT